MDDVVIVGGGPVGFINALGLARAGVRVAVIEAEPQIVDSPRAAVYFWSVLDGLDRLGILEETESIGIRKQDYTYRVRRTGGDRRRAPGSSAKCSSNPCECPFVTYGPHVSAYVRARGAHNVYEAVQAVDNDFWGSPEVQPPSDPAWPAQAQTRFLFVGRPKREKGLVVLAQAWRAAELEPPEAALVLAGLMAFGLAGHIAATRFIHDQQARQLDELTEVVLRRSEFAVDFAIASLDELAGRGLATCDPASLQAIRLHVYQRSAVKDVRLVNSDGSVICSAYSETLEFDKGWVDRADMLASRDSKLMLFRVEQF